MVKQAGNTKHIFTSLKTAFVPQLCHQMHTHCFLLEGHVMISLPALSCSSFLPCSPLPHHARGDDIFCPMPCSPTLAPATGAGGTLPEFPPCMMVSLLLIPPFFSPPVGVGTSLGRDHLFRIPWDASHVRGQVKQAAALSLQQ